VHVNTILAPSNWMVKPHGDAGTGSWPTYTLLPRLQHPASSVMIRKLRTGEYRLYSRKIDPRTGKRRNLGTFPTREAAEKHEREVQYFKRR
jgi:hypothetical protein